MSTLQDILSEDQVTEEPRIIVRQQYSEIVSELRDVHPGLERSKTLGEAKSLLEFYDLVDQAIEMYETRAGIPEHYRVNFTEEQPDFESETETITFSLVRREPGAFSQGAPFQGDIRNLRPMFREEGEDPENPGYRQITTGYWYDNIVQFTCWARTNKTANKRARWFEDLMEEYAWWFTMQGCQRAIYQGQETDLVAVVNENKWYGRPINFFVRTEKLRTFKEKTLEEIYIKLAVERE